MKEYLINRSDTLAFPVPNMNTGMTLRDYFAAKAMQPFLDQLGCRADQRWFDEVAEGSYKIADAMMEARKA